MIVVKKILVPVDFSAGSREAFLHATQLAQHFGASVTILHCVDDTSLKHHIGKFGNVFRREARADLVRNAVRRLEEYLLHKHVDNVPYSRKVVLGSPSRMIGRVAARGGYDLIVLAASGKSLFEVTIFGNTTDKVVREAPCPVLCIRAGGRRLYEP